MDAGNDRLERDPPVGMGLGIEEDLRVLYALAGGPCHVCPGQVVEILFLEQYPAAGVIDVEERLQVAEYVGTADLLNRGIGQANAVSTGQREHQLGFERALDVKMQLGLGQVSGEGREVPCHSPASYGRNLRGYQPPTDFSAEALMERHVLAIAVAFLLTGCG